MSDLPAELWQRWWRELPGTQEPSRTASSQGFVLRSDHLAVLGVSRARARTKVRNGQWVMPARGVISPVCINGFAAPPWTVARRRCALVASAALLKHPGHVVSCRSAAVLHGLPTFALPEVAELTASHAAGAGPRNSSHRYAAFVSEVDLQVWFGAPVTSVGRTVVDLARHRRRDGLMAADAALREDLVTTTELRAALDAGCGWPGIRQARAVLGLADRLAESPLESLTRLALHDDGFPPAMLQVQLMGYRLDFYWPSLRLVLEADGRGKYTGDELWLEKRREADLRSAGLRVERVRWADVVSAWPRTSAMLRGYFRAA